MRTHSNNAHLSTTQKQLDHTLYRCLSAITDLNSNGLRKGAVMNPGVYKTDMARDARRLRHDACRSLIDAVALISRFLKDMKAEAKHLADPSQWSSIIERHCGFIAMVLLISLVFYLGMIAVLLSQHASH